MYVFLLKRRDSPLDGCCNGVEDDGVVQDPGKFEAVGNLFAEGDTLAVVQFFDFFEQRRRLGD